MGGVWLALATVVALLLPHSHLAAAAVALTWALTAAAQKRLEWWGRALRVSAFPALGLAILSRSDYWFEPVFTTIRRMLELEQPLGWNEQIAPTADWWKVMLIGLGFVTFYWHFSRWPERAHKPAGKRRSAMGVCAATQCVIVAASGWSTVTGVTLAMLAGGVVAVLLTQEFKPIFLAFFIMAPAYALSCLPLLLSLSVLSALVLAAFTVYYGLGPRMLDASRGVALGLALTPLVALNRFGPEATFGAVLLCAALMVGVHLTRREGTTGMELAAGLIGFSAAFLSPSTLTQWGLAYTVVLLCAVAFTTVRRLTPSATLYLRSGLLWCVYALLLIGFHQLNPYAYFLPLAAAFSAIAVAAQVQKRRRQQAFAPPVVSA